MGFFTAATQQLLAAASGPARGITWCCQPLGIDRVDCGYYAGKRAQEDLALSGPVPATVLRTTQFHEFAAQMLARVRGPVALVPRMRVQPVAAGEVATALVRLAAGPAAGVAPELAGPQMHDWSTSPGGCCAGGQRRPVLPVRLPGAAGKAVGSGALLPTVPGRGAAAVRRVAERYRRPRGC